MKILIVKDHHSTSYVNYDDPVLAYKWIFDTYFKNGDWDWHIKEYAKYNQDNEVLRYLKVARETGDSHHLNHFILEYSCIADIRFYVEDVIDPSSGRKKLE